MELAAGREGIICKTTKLSFACSQQLAYPCRVLLVSCQYTPVLSIATWLTPNSNSHSFSSIKNLVVEENSRVSRGIPVPSTVATITFLCTSKPQHLSINWQNSTACKMSTSPKKVVLNETDLSIRLINIEDLNDSGDKYSDKRNYARFAL